MTINGSLTTHRVERFVLRPHHIAWLVVLVSFVCFCAISAALVAGVYWFVFDSSVPLTVQLVVSHGYVNVQPLNGQQIGIIKGVPIDLQTSLVVADQSQGVLEFLDRYSNAVVATTTLTSGTELTLTAASRPRFEVSHRQYAITLDNFSGQMMVTASPGQRAFRMDVNSEAGVATLTNDGQYTIYTDQNSSTSASQLHVFNQGGDAQIALPSTPAQTVYGNTIGTVSTDNSIWTNGTPPDTLLVSGLFEGQPVSTSNSGLPGDWQCVTGADDPTEPLGNWARSADYQNGALHLWRVGENLQHASTACVIYPDGQQGWLDTSAYQTLRLHVRFKLLAHDPASNNLPVQDIPVCGIEGTECPVMLEIAATICPADKTSYTTPCPVDNSTIQYWHHGFYATPDPSNPPTYPSTCDTCHLAHDHVNPDVWYFYDSQDLHQQFANGLIYIKQLSVYASGHQYDVVIGEVSLLGSNS